MSAPSLSLVMSRFSLDPVRNGRLLREAFECDSTGFIRTIVETGRPDVSDRGFRYALTLLRGHDLLIPAVARPDSTSLQQAVALTRCLLTLDPAFLNSMLDELFVRRELQDVSCALRILDLVAEYPGNVANWRLISKLYGHSDHRVRSRSASLLARFRYDEQASASRFEEGEPRVRANIVEALWDAGNAKGARLLEQALADSNNRVVGNACLALYNSGDSRVLPELVRMLASDRPEFQVTAAWVMGRTRDCRFHGPLSAESRSEHPELRKTARRSLSELETLPVASTEVSILPVLGSAPVFSDGVRFWVRPQSSAGAFRSGLKPVDFILFSDDLPVWRYSVDEAHDSSNTSLRIVCPADEPELLHLLARDAGQKNRSDRWAISVYGAGVASRQQMLEASFLQDPGALSKTLSSGPPGALNAARSVRSLLRLPGTGSSDHLVLFLDGSRSSEVDLGALERECAERKILLHCCGSRLGSPSEDWSSLRASFQSRYVVDCGSAGGELSLRIRDRSQSPPVVSGPVCLTGTATALPAVKEFLS